jgi:hypothetical protein
MKQESLPPAERLENWQAQRRAAFDEIDLTLAVMACIQPIQATAASRYFHSSPLLDGPSVLVGFLRMAFIFFCILAPA